MSSKVLAVSLALLLVAMFSLPGASFSLSSSVTSYNNTMTVVDDGILSFSKDDYKSEEVSTPSWAPSDSEVLEISKGDHGTFNGSGGGKSDVDVVINTSCTFAIYIRLADGDTSKPQFTLSCGEDAWKYKLDGSVGTARDGYLSGIVQSNGNGNGNDRFYKIVPTVNTTGILKFTKGESNLTLSMESNVSNGCQLHVYFVILDEEIS